MKPAILSLAFLLFAFTTNLPSSFSNAEQVRDTDSNPIFPGGRYYVKFKPAIKGPPGGGVYLGKTENSTCPLTVLQHYSALENGQPVKFSVGQGTPEIFTGSILDISFTKKPNCAESPNWVVVLDDYPKSWVSIEIGGVEQDPCKQILSGTFTIQKLYLGYKLVFCPRFTAPPELCFDIGTYDDKLGNFGRRLVLTNGETLEVVFVNVDPIPTRRNFAI